MTSPYLRARDELKALGMKLRLVPGEYRVNFKHGTPETEYVTEDLRDALRYGREMAKGKHPEPPEPPLGPTGRPNSRYAQMCRQNRKVAARRAKRTAGKKS